jgi:hypothetical protein
MRAGRSTIEAKAGGDTAGLVPCAIRVEKKFATTKKRPRQDRYVERQAAGLRVMRVEVKAVDAVEFLVDTGYLKPKPVERDTWSWSEVEAAGTRFFCDASKQFGARSAMIALLKKL